MVSESLNVSPDGRLRAFGIGLVGENLVKGEHCQFLAIVLLQQRNLGKALCRGNLLVGSRLASFLRDHSLRIAESPSSRSCCSRR